MTKAMMDKPEEEFIQPEAGKQSTDERGKPDRPAVAPPAPQ
jgi:hypothetical protein